MPECVKFNASGALVKLPYSVALTKAKYDGYAIFGNEMSISVKLKGQAHLAIKATITDKNEILNGLLFH